jgi:hypothetical protein
VLNERCCRAAHPMCTAKSELSVQLQLTLYTPLLRFRAHIRQTLDRVLSESVSGAGGHALSMDVMKIITAYLSFQPLSWSAVPGGARLSTTFTRHLPRVYEQLYPLCQSQAMRSQLEVLEVHIAADQKQRAEEEAEQRRKAMAARRAEVQKELQRQRDYEELTAKIRTASINAHRMRCVRAEGRKRAFFLTLGCDPVCRCSQTGRRATALCVWFCGGRCDARSN